MSQNFRFEMEGVRQWYDEVAQAFVSRYRGKEGEYFKLFEEDVAEELVPDSPSILDLGCGHGRLAGRLIHRGKGLIVGVDLSLEMLKQAHVHEFPRIQANAVDLCFKDESFDTVVSMGMFEYLEDPTPFLIEINRILKIDGALVFTFHQMKPSQKPVPEEGDAPYFGKTVAERNALWNRITRTLEEMNLHLFEHGFAVEKVRRVFFRLPTAMFHVGVGVRRFSRVLGNKLVAFSKITEEMIGARFSEESNGNTIILARKRK
jgi:ubiquinone/menaquinone biosynthesis C-methylase UbiE